MDVYGIVTEKILKALEEGTVPWQKPWIGSGRAINYVSRKPYKGINTLLLDQPGEYLTFKQCESLGGKVRKGEKSSMIVFFTFSEHKEKGTDGEDKITTFPVLKYYNVFHISQCEGIESKLEPPSPEADPLAEGETIIDGYISRSGVGFEAVKGSDRAFYRPSEDRVVVPHISQYKLVEEYYSTTFHELTHSTGHSSRLKRFGERNDGIAAFGNDVYSKEELIAEIGSSMLMSIAGIERSETFTNSAAYLQSWLNVLKGDKRLIVTAANAAQKAVDLILGKPAEA